MKSVQEERTPPTINTEAVEPHFKDKFDFILGKEKNKIVRYAMKDTFGFGGHIAITVFKKYSRV